MKINHNGHFKSICYLRPENKGLICIGARTYDLNNEPQNDDQKISSQVKKWDIDFKNSSTAFAESLMSGSQKEP